MLDIGVEFNGKKKLLRFTFDSVNEINIEVLKKDIEKAFSITGEYDLNLYNKTIESFHQLEYARDLPITVPCRFEVIQNAETQSKLSDQASDSGISHSNAQSSNGSNDFTVTDPKAANTTLQQSLWRPGLLEFGQNDFSFIIFKELTDAQAKYQSQKLANIPTSQHHLSFNAKKEFNDRCEEHFKRFCTADGVTKLMKKDACNALIKAFPCTAEPTTQYNTSGIAALMNILSNRVAEWRRKCKAEFLEANPGESFNCINAKFSVNDCSIYFGLFSFI
jgi:hypothetical protein